MEFMSDDVLYELGKACEDKQNFKKAKHFYQNISSSYKFRDDIDKTLKSWKFEDAKFVSFRSSEKSTAFNSKQIATANHVERDLTNNNHGPHR